MSLFLTTEILLLLVCVGVALAISYMLYKDIEIKLTLMFSGIMLLICSTFELIGNYGFALFALCFSVAIFMFIHEKTGGN